jgi:hypothetical protein
MSISQLIAALYRLHETRVQMSVNSIYHGQYVEEAVRLNKLLVEAGGKNYLDYTEEERKEAIAEDALLF